MSDRVELGVDATEIVVGVYNKNCMLFATTRKRSQRNSGNGLHMTRNGNISVRLDQWMMSREAKIRIFTRTTV